MRKLFGTIKEHQPLTDFIFGYKEESFYWNELFDKKKDSVMKFKAPNGEDYRFEPKPYDYDKLEKKLNFKWKKYVFAPTKNLIFIIERIKKYNKGYGLSVHNK